MFRGLITIACVFVIAAAGLWLVQQLVPEYERWRENRAERQRTEDRIAYEATPQGRCDRLVSQYANYRRTGDVTALPMPFGEFYREVRACEADQPR